MRKVILATAGVAVVAFVVAAMGSAQPTASTATTRAVAKAPVLPKLPAEIASRKRLIVGAKCDTPPFGYIDVRGKNAGVDIEIARQFARYAFGTAQRLSIVCAPTAVREPLLTTNRVDMVISTFTYTADRDTRIDFSRAYYNASGRVLVKNTSPIQRLADISGKRVATTSGSIYDRWMKRCFPQTQVVVLDSVTNAVLAFNQGRADAVMFDDTSLALIAATDPSSKMIDDVFLEQPVRHRHQAGQRRAQALGRRPPQPHEAEGPVRPDHPEQHRAALRAGVPEEQPAAEPELHVPVAEPAEPRHGVPVA